MMNKRALVIRIAGDPGIGGAIMEGMRRAAIGREDPYADMRRERERLYRQWRMDEIRRASDDSPPPRGVEKALLILYGMAWYGISEAYRRLSAWNRGE